MFNYSLGLSLSYAMYTVNHDSMYCMGRVRRFILTVRGNDLAINKKDKTMDEDFKFHSGLPIA